MPEPVPFSGWSPLARYRLWLVLSLVVVVPLGYGVRFAGDAWWNDVLGSIAYEVFWVLLGAALWPKLPLRWVAVGVCLVTMAIEGLQLWQNPVYLAIRATFLGRLVLGNTFLWSDFPPYVVGSWVGWAWARSLKQEWGRPRL